MDLVSQRVGPPTNPERFNRGHEASGHRSGPFAARCVVPLLRGGLFPWTGIKLANLFKARDGRGDLFLNL